MDCTTQCNLANVPFLKSTSSARYSVISVCSVARWARLTRSPAAAALEASPRLAHSCYSWVLEPRLQVLVVGLGSERMMAPGLSGAASASGHCSPRPVAASQPAALSPLAAFTGSTTRGASAVASWPATRPSVLAFS